MTEASMRIQTKCLVYANGVPQEQAWCATVPWVSSISGTFMPDVSAYYWPLSCYTKRNGHLFLWRPMHQVCMDNIKQLACKDSLSYEIDPKLDKLMEQSKRAEHGGCDARRLRVQVWLSTETSKSWSVTSIAGPPIWVICMHQHQG